MSSKKQVFIFTHWGARERFYRIFSFLLSRIRGVDVTVFPLGRFFLSPDPKWTKKCFEQLEQEVREKIKKLRDKGIEEITLFGTSLGTIAAFKIAKGISKNIKIHLVINLSAADFSYSIWNGSATQEIRKGCEQRGGSLELMNKELSGLSPIFELEKLHEVRFTGFFSVNDFVLVSSNVRTLIDGIKKEIPDSRIRINSLLGHYLGGFKNLFLSLFLVKY